MSGTMERMTHYAHTNRRCTFDALQFFYNIIAGYAIFTIEPCLDVVSLNIPYFYGFCERVRSLSLSAPL